MKINKKAFIINFVVLCIISCGGKEKTANQTEKLNLNITYTFVDWKNAGFNPEVPLLEEDFPDIAKHSMGIALSYWY